MNIFEYSSSTFVLFLMVKIVQVISIIATSAMIGRRINQILNALFSMSGNNSELKKYPNLYNL